MNWKILEVIAVCKYFFCDKIRIVASIGINTRAGLIYLAFRQAIDFAQLARNSIVLQGAIGSQQSSALSSWVLGKYILLFHFARKRKSQYQNQEDFSATD